MMQKVVGVAFIENGKLLIVQSHKSSKTNSWTLVGGGVEVRETLVEAASDLEQLFTFSKACCE